MSRKATIALALVLAAILFFSVNVIANTLLTGQRLDLTENKLYTLSDGTRQILENLKDPVTLRFYFSEDLARDHPATRAYAQRVRELLQRYSAIAGDKLRLKIIEPAPFSKAEDQAVAYGLTGAPVGTTGDMLYFGLVGTNTVDQQEVIEFFDPGRERYLEYDITKLIYTLSNPDRPTIGVISALPLAFGAGGMQAAMQGRSQPYVVYERLNQLYSLKQVKPDFRRIGDDIDVLWIVHPPQLSEAQLYAIDQFVMRGGRALIFVDPFAESAAYSQGRGRAMPTTSNLAPLFTAWGVGFAPEEVVADLNLAQQVSTGRRGGGIKDYVAWLRLGDQQLNDADLVTADLSTVLIASAGHIWATGDTEITFEPLMTSTPQAMLLAKERLSGMPDPDSLLRDYIPGEESHVMAARISGPVPSAFPDGPPRSDAGNGTDTGGADTDSTDTGGADGAASADSAPHLARSDGPINAIVVADSDLLEDRFWVQVQNFLGEQVATPTADNGNFVINAVENLAGSDALISLRSRGVSSRPFEVVNDLRRQAEAQYLEKERRLQQRLDATEKKIAELQSQRSEGGLYLTPEQKAEIAQFREEALATRRELRRVQHNLRKDIEGLANRLKFINIGLTPLAVAGLAILLGLARRRRYRRARRAS